MKTQEIKKIEKSYICENCGTKHKNIGDVFKSQFSGKEICTKCSVKVSLYKLDWEDYIDVPAHSEDVVSGYEYWQEEYKNALEEVQNKMYKEIEEINKRYIQRDEDFFRKYIKNI